CVTCSSAVTLSRLFFLQAEDGIRDRNVTGVQTCALPICQARIVFNAAKRMIELNSELKSRVQVFQDRIYVPNTASELRPLPAEPNALQGYDPTLMSVDELPVVTAKVWVSVSSAAG